MTQKSAANAQRQDFIACTIAGDINSYPHLITAMHKTLGPAWGHLDRIHAAAYLNSPSARRLGFVVVVVDDASETQIALAAEAIAAARVQQLPVVLVTDIPAEQQHPLLREGGVPCVLPTQVSARQMAEVVAVIAQNVVNQPASVAIPGQGRVTAVQGLASGCGTSLVSRAMAETLSLSGTPVCLVQFSDEPGDPYHVQERALSPSLTVLELPHAGSAALAAHLPQIIEETRARHAHVVLDLPPVVIPSAATLLPICDTYFALAEITPRAAQNTRNLRRVMADGGRSLQDVRFVMNRVLSDQRSAARLREMAAALCIEVSHVLPDARPATDLGRVRPGTGLAQSISRLAAECETETRGHRAA